MLCPAPMLGVKCAIRPRQRPRGVRPRCAACVPFTLRRASLHRRHPERSVPVFLPVCRVSCDKRRHTQSRDLSSMSPTICDANSPRRHVECGSLPALSSEGLPLFAARACPDVLQPRPINRARGLACGCPASALGYLLAILPGIAHENVAQAFPARSAGWA